MYRRPLIGLAFLWLAIATPAFAQITAFWQQVTITPQAIGNDPALASMQCWDLMTTTSGDWSAAGMRAVLPTGSFFYKHPMGGVRPPSPAAIAAGPALAFTTHVNTPKNNGLNNGNTHLLGGFENEPMSIGDVTADQPGVFSISWGDLFVDLPGTYQISRLTFPQGLLPNIYHVSRVAQVSPQLTANIPQIAEPGTLILLAPAGLLLRRQPRGRRRTPSCCAGHERGTFYFST